MSTPIAEMSTAASICVYAGIAIVLIGLACILIQHIPVPRRNRGAVEGASSSLGVIGTIISAAKELLPKRDRVYVFVIVVGVALIGLGLGVSTGDDDDGGSSTTPTVTTGTTTTG
jgi:hypothetical protein